MIRQTEKTKPHSDEELQVTEKKLKNEVPIGPICGVKSSNKLCRSWPTKRSSVLHFGTYSSSFEVFLNIFSTNGPHSSALWSNLLWRLKQGEVRATSPGDREKRLNENLTMKIWDLMGYSLRFFWKHSESLYPTCNVGVWKGVFSSPFVPFF